MTLSLRGAIATAFVAFVISLPVHAQGWYGGLGFGESDYDLVNEQDSSLKAFIGYQANDNLGVEFSYVDLGRGKVSNFIGSASVEASGLELSAVGFLPVANNVRLLAKAGLFNFDTTVKANIPGFISGSADDSGTEFTYGLGAEFDLGKSFALRAEWQSYDLGDSDDVTVIGASAVFRF